MSLARTLVVKTSALRPVEQLVRRSFLFRPLVRRFIAGDTLEEALKASQALLSRGLRVSLDYLGENTKSEAEARDAVATYKKMLHRVAELPEVTSYDTASGEVEPINISIKLTQCGLDQGEGFAEENYREVLDLADQLHTFVRIDMESSEYTDRTMNMIERVRKDYLNTGTVLQSCLYRTPQDIAKVIAWKARTRLVKGAYLEPPAVAISEKAKVDLAYVEQAKQLLEQGHYPAIATQDEKIILELNRFVAERQIAKSRFEYQMLYGIRRDLQESLRAEGYNVRIYVPFGDSWYPYFTRASSRAPGKRAVHREVAFKGLGRSFSLP